MSLKAGDVVRLKSGGPLMTIVAEEGNIAGCQWFKNDELKSADFVKASLEEYKEPDFESFAVHIP